MKKHTKNLLFPEFRILKPVIDADPLKQCDTVIHIEKTVEKFC